MKTPFDDHRMSWEQALEFTADSLRTYGAGHPHWCIAWSGGKDSTAVLTVALYLISTGLVDRPAVDILNAEEEARIRELIELKTWPRKWTGDEPTADEPYEEADAAGMFQTSLFGN